MHSSQNTFGSYQQFRYVCLFVSANRDVYRDSLCIADSSVLLEMPAKRRGPLKKTVCDALFRLSERTQPTQAINFHGPLKLYKGNTLRSNWDPSRFELQLLSFDLVCQWQVTSPSSS